MNARYLLDTSAASYAITKKSLAFDHHVAKVPMAEIGVSTVTEAELRYGLARRFTKNTGSPTFLWLTWFNVTTILKQTWSINYSTPVKNGWREPFYCWRDSGKKTSPRK